MTVLSPKVAKLAYSRGYSDRLSNRPITSNPYKKTHSAGDRWELWQLGWIDADRGKPNQTNDITYEWLLS